MNSLNVNHNPILSLFTRIVRRVPPVEQERLTLSDHSSSHPYFSWVRGARSLFFVDHCLSIRPFYFGHCIDCPS
jgi:hypothetical protein